MYAIKLAEDNRILHICTVLKVGNYDGMPIVDTLPEGDVTEYKYINGEYVHDPLPKEAEAEPEPTAEELLNAMLGVTSYE